MVPVVCESHPQNYDEMVRLGLRLSEEDLYNINHSSLKDAILQFGGGCTAEMISDKGLLYEGFKVVPYCPRCGTAISSHEVAQGYRLVLDRLLADLNGLLT